MINIYSIKEIVEATNGFLTKKSEKTSKKSNFKKEKEKEKEIQTKNTKKKILILDKKNEISENNFQLKHDVKNVVVDELYLYLKKKIKKNRTF